MSHFKIYLPILLTLVLITNVAGCAASQPVIGPVARAADLMSGVSPRPVDGRKADAALIKKHGKVFHRPV